MGNYKEEKINDFTAVIFQHENDHINRKVDFGYLENGFNDLQVEK